LANQKISALTALTGANVEQLADVLPIVDNSASATKKILVSELAQALLVQGTAQASTSGTSIDFTGIPAWVKRITVMFFGVSTNGTSDIIIQLGDAGGPETSGYLSRAAGVEGSSAGATSTAGLIVTNGMTAASALHGSIALSLEDASDFTWVGTGMLNANGASILHASAGSKATSATLTQVRITTVNGSDTFDAGEINIQYQ
jgi:hypothetical protein